MSHKEVEKAFIIPGMMWPLELYELFNLFSTSTLHIEVGSFCGKSLYATAAGMAEFRTEKRIISVDDMSIMPEVMSAHWVKNVLLLTMNEIAEKFNITCEYYQKTSEEAAVEILKSTSIKVTSVFIDADHSQEMVARDILAWWPLLRNNCILAGHDYCYEHPGVMNAVNDIFLGNHSTIPNTRIWYITKKDFLNGLVNEYKNRAVA